MSLIYKVYVNNFGRRNPFCQQMQRLTVKKRNSYRITLLYVYFPICLFGARQDASWLEMSLLWSIIMLVWKFQATTSMQCEDTAKNVEFLFKPTHSSKLVEYVQLIIRSFSSNRPYSGTNNFVSWRSETPFSEK